MKGYRDFVKSYEDLLCAMPTIATISTTLGNMKAELYDEKAPKTVANFIALANSGFYDGKIFHRVIKGFVVQGGCPKGDGTGGTDEKIPLETHPELKHIDGALGMARSMDKNSASCQFYICDGPQNGLDGGYAVFGRIIEGMEVVRKLASVATDGMDRPKEELKIVQVKIH